MKILELRFKNLGSLYGEWEIDFTNPGYVSDGIFALTGPTGAGKSTILDAVCLALYGQTPRLGKITKSSNEIMSRQTGECYAEVLFESRDGRYRCHWEQRRARKAADGKLQDQEHQIAEAETGKILENKKSLVSGIIEEKTGMDFDRFTRSILLAQGSFDIFLKADAEVKSRILEQITGTEIYSRISRSVHERLREEREKLKVLEAEISGIIILDKDQEISLKFELDEKQGQERKLSEEAAGINKAVTWLTTLGALKEELISLKDEAGNLKKQFDAFKPESDKLKEAERAASIEGDYASLEALRNQYEDDQKNLENERKTLPELETSAHVLKEALINAEKHTLAAKEQQKKMAPLIQKVRSLDQNIAGEKRILLENEELCQKDKNKIERDKNTLAELEEKRREYVENLKLVENYLEEHREDEWLIGGLAGVEEQLNRLDSLQKEIEQKEARFKRADSDLALARRKLQNSNKKIEVCRLELKEASSALEAGRNSLELLLNGRLLREYRTEKDSLLREKAYQSRIAELEELRALLEDGKPCPLCGSLEHPLAEGNIPEPDKIDKEIEALEKLIAEAEDLESSIKKLETLEASAGKKLLESEKLKEAALGDKRGSEKALEELKGDLDRLKVDFNELKGDLFNKLRPLGIEDTLGLETSELSGSLKTRLKAMEDAVKEKAEREKQISDIESRIQSLRAVIETQSIALSEKLERLEVLENELSSNIGKRKDLYGEKDPDSEENRLYKEVIDAEEVEKNARNQSIQVQQDLGAVKSHIESLKKRISRAEPDLKMSESSFLSALESSGFSDENQFVNARLSKAERSVLSKRAKILEDARTELNAKLKDRENRLAEERAKNVTNKSVRELELQLGECNKSLGELQDSIAGIRHKLNENIDAKSRMKEKQEIIQAQKEECMQYEKLHGLIGSADGKKYRNFAQGLTFGIMVSHANRQLEKMSDRYLLIRDENQPLELNVLDNYQAGEIRTTKNLSGGESFIVSLSLALGLSKMASRKVRVDSMFLDEGFGTLDEDALETALETLSSLQQNGKLIGIISHVSALKERISTQITISPVSGGHSSISGPGCKRLS